jgi:hypothetical protein
MSLSPNSNSLKPKHTIKKHNQPLLSQKLFLCFEMGVLLFISTDWPQTHDLHASASPFSLSSQECTTTLGQKFFIGFCYHLFKSNCLQLCNI